MQPHKLQRLIKEVPEKDWMTLFYMANMYSLHLPACLSSYCLQIVATPTEALDTVHAFTLWVFMHRCGWYNIIGTVRVHHLVTDVYQNIHIDRCHNVMVH